MASSNVIAHGIDLVEVARIRRIVERHGERFLAWCFTPGETQYAARSPRRRDEHLAARFAAKEAVLKALGTGWSRGIRWTDAEVAVEPSGRPAIRLHGRAAEIAGELGVTRWLVSLTHTGEYAMASVIGVGHGT